MEIINDIFLSNSISSKHRKNHLKELYRQYAEKAGYYYGVRKGRLIDGWMIDEEEDIWLYEMCCLKYFDDPPQFSSETYYIFNYKGKTYEVLMIRNYIEGSRKLSDNPFRIRWEILSIMPLTFEEVGFKDMIKIITDAIKTRPDMGLEKFVKNFDIKVKYVGPKPWKRKISPKNKK